MAFYFDFMLDFLEIVCSNWVVEEHEIAPLASIIKRLVTKNCSMLPIS